MNRECFGTKFKTDEGWYWCCLGDGSFTKVDRHLKDGDTCPACKRIICNLTEIEVETRVKITKQICFKTGRNWLDFNEMILP